MLDSGREGAREVGGWWEEERSWGEGGRWEEEGRGREERGGKGYLHESWRVSMGRASLCYNIPVIHPPNHAFLAICIRRTGNDRIAQLILLVLIQQPFLLRQPALNDFFIDFDIILNRREGILTHIFFTKQRGVPRQTRAAVPRVDGVILGALELKLPD